MKIILSIILILFALVIWYIYTKSKSKTTPLEDEVTTTIENVASTVFRTKDKRYMNRNLDTLDLSDTINTSNTTKGNNYNTLPKF